MEISSPVRKHIGPTKTNKQRPPPQQKQQKNLNLMRTLSKFELNKSQLHISLSEDFDATAFKTYFSFMEGDGGEY